MYFSKRYKYRTLHGVCYYVIKTKKEEKRSRERKTNYVLCKILLSSFSILHAKILYMAK